MKTKLSLAFVLFAFLTGCQPSTSAELPVIKKGMIKVTVLYPNGAGKQFDMDYYRTKHFPLVKRLLGSALKGTAIDKGISSGSPHTPLPYLAIGYLYFNTMADFQTAIGANLGKIMADIPKFTDSKPLIQISEVIE